ncbi:hypothetical protein E4U92_26580 [Streptomyces galbus]|uniref:Uncharacterized protein n=1 Tax=Streptomyces galbus TaxID=33898 RepID=A0A4U5WVS4_STRGB|nr:hypothetical protein E4U92_26580 [Streptomyces galbus]
MGARARLTAPTQTTPHWSEAADAIAQPSLTAAKLRGITGVLAPPDPGTERSMRATRSCRWTTSTRVVDLPVRAKAEAGSIALTGSLQQPPGVAFLIDHLAANTAGQAAGTSGGAPHRRS